MWVSIYTYILKLCLLRGTRSSDTLVAMSINYHTDLGF